MHKPTIEQTNIAILRSEAQDISAYRNLFGDFHNVAFKEDYKTVKQYHIVRTAKNTTLLEQLKKYHCWEN
jgi:hypothetical protein